MGVQFTIQVGGGGGGSFFNKGVQYIMGKKLTPGSIYYGVQNTI